jgi:heat shock protein HslJ
VTLNATNLIFTGNTGCNSMSGSFNFSNKDIQFGRNIVTSKMSCNEYDESKFISALKKADNYTVNGNTLELKQGSTLLLTFKKA